MLNTGNFYWLLIPAGLIASIGLVIGLRETARHPDWLIFPIALIYLSLPISLLNEHIRPFIHYGGLLLFCLPAVPRILGAKFLTEGDFRLYWIYFGWALITTTYSIAPEFSIGRLLAALLGFGAVVACVGGVKGADDVHKLILRFTLAVLVIVGILVVGGLALPHSVTWQTPEEGYSPEYVAALHALGMGIYGLDRFRGVFGNANDVGQLMLITVGLVIACWDSANRRLRLVLAAGALAMVFAAFKADSRSSFVGIGFGMVLYILWRYRTRGFIALSIAAVVLGVAFVASGKFTAYISRGDVATLTGRTDMWAFVITQIKQRPILGYGYEVGGAIFSSKYFPIWYGPWDMGPRSSLHDGYLSHAIGVGLPATFLWLFLVIRPWVYIFSHREDPWKLKPLVFLIIIPALVLNITEASFDDFAGEVGLLCGLCWALAERYRLYAKATSQTVEQERFNELPAATQALLFGQRV